MGQFSMAYMSTKSLDLRQVHSPDSGALGCDIGSMPSPKRLGGYLFFWQIVICQIKSYISYRCSSTSYHIISHPCVCFNSFIDWKLIFWTTQHVTWWSPSAQVTPNYAHFSKRPWFRPLEASNQTWGSLFFHENWEPKYLTLTQLRSSIKMYQDVSRLVSSDKIAWDAMGYCGISVSTALKTGLFRSFSQGICRPSKNATDYVPRGQSTTRRHRLPMPKFLLE